jgi:hypothetical protein
LFVVKKRKPKPTETDQKKNNKKKLVELFPFDRGRRGGFGAMERDKKKYRRNRVADGRQEGER